MILNKNNYLLVVCPSAPHVCDGGFMHGLLSWMISEVAPKVTVEFV